MAMDRDFLIDLFADFGPVTIRRMFSGFGISVEGTNFALALRGGIFLRADEQTFCAIRGRGIEAVPVSDQSQDRHGGILLAAAGAAL
jgi:TfoX/Sxy family transcriptional regulator of competence genes